MNIRVLREYPKACVSVPSSAPISSVTRYLMRRALIYSLSAVALLFLGFSSCKSQDTARIPEFTGSLRPLVDSLIKQGVVFQCGKSPSLPLGKGHTYTHATMCSAVKSDTTFFVAVDHDNTVIYRYRAWRVPESDLPSTRNAMSTRLTELFGDPTRCGQLYQFRDTIWKSSHYFVRLTVHLEDMSKLPATLLLEEQQEEFPCLR
jgi:hypothetical protein